MFHGNIVKIYISLFASENKRIQNTQLSVVLYKNIAKHNANNLLISTADSLLEILFGEQVNKNDGILYNIGVNTTLRLWYRKNNCRVIVSWRATFKFFKNNTTVLSWHTLYEHNIVPQRRGGNNMQKFHLTYIRKVIITDSGEVLKNKY